MFLEHLYAIKTNSLAWNRKKTWTLIRILLFSDGIKQPETESYSIGRGRRILREVRLIVLFVSGEPQNLKNLAVVAKLAHKRCNFMLFFLALLQGLGMPQGIIK